MQSSYRIKTNCKINLYLEITEKRADGFHNIFSLFIPIPWEDNIIFTPNKSSNKPFSFSSSDSLIQENNTITKAALALLPFRKNSVPLEIFLQKNVPYQAGLGSASANAAGTLLFLNQFWECGFPLSELEKIADKISSDAPFFIYNTPALVSGKGEVLNCLNINPTYHWLVLKPKNIAISTAWAYEEVAKRRLYSHISSRQQSLINAFNSGLAAQLAPCLYNTFEEALSPHYPYITHTKALLKSQGALNALLSGSGSSIFGLFPDQKTLQAASNFFMLNYAEEYELYPKFSG